MGVVIFTGILMMSSANPGIDDALSEVTSIGFGVSNATGTLIYTSSGITTLSVTGTLNSMTLLKVLREITQVGI